jgi:hypothetical protein
MNFTVIWTERAEQHLAALLIGGDRDAITAAADRIDHLLARDPLDQGESRGHDGRLMFERPLGAYFRVEPTTRRVYVVTVGPARPPR